MGRRLLLVWLTMFTPAAAQQQQTLVQQSAPTAPNEDVPDPRTTGLNRTIEDRIEAVNAHSVKVKAAEEQYARDRAVYEKALRENAEQVAAADARRKAWEIQTANWTKTVKGSGERMDKIVR